MSEDINATSQCPPPHTQPGAGHPTKKTVRPSPAGGASHESMYRLLPKGLRSIYMSGELAAQWVHRD